MPTSNRQDTPPAKMSTIRAATATKTPGLIADRASRRALLASLGSARAPTFAETYLLFDGVAIAPSEIPLACEDPYAACRASQPMPLPPFDAELDRVKFLRRQVIGHRPSLMTCCAHRFFRSPCSKLKRRCALLCCDFGLDLTTKRQTSGA